MTIEEIVIHPRVWSPEQEAFYAWFANGTGHLVGRALAGTGKTTTIVEGVNRAPEARILVCAFNKRIAEELQSRITNDRVEVKTLHGLGFSCVRRYWEKVNVEQRAGQRADGLAEAVCGKTAPDAIKRLVSKLHTKAREIAPLAATPDDLVDLALEFDCAPDKDWEKDGYDLSYVCVRALQAMELAASEKPAAGIDFADMLFLPVRNHWLRPEYDLVVVDEGQDMTISQLLLAEGMCAGRFVIVGDNRQAIYAFRGADSESLDRLKTKLGAAELGLTTTYRCCQAVVREANRLVPALQAAPDAPEGSIADLPGIEALVEAAENKTDKDGHSHDFILSRTNAPLARVAMALIRRQKRVRIQGKDIGAGLKAIVRKLATGRAKDSMPEFLRKLATWRDREVERARALKKDSQAEAVLDKAETIEVIADGATGVREVEARLDALFDDARNHGTIVCSSIHKAKGLEAERVFVLRDTLYPPVACTCGHRHPRGKSGCERCECRRYVASPAQQQEEQNIEYVGITRAKSALVWVAGK